MKRNQVTNLTKTMSLQQKRELLHRIKEKERMHNFFDLPYNAEDCKLIKQALQGNN